MLIAAINYQNNMSYALTFLLATLFVIATLHTFANLSGLTVRALHAQPVFAGQLSEFVLQVERHKPGEHYALHLQWPQGSEALVNLLERDRERVALHVRTQQRGWFNPGRLLVESNYPLGLLRCWSLVDLDMQALVYPQPLACGQPPAPGGAEADGVAIPAAGSDDFYGFRAYRPGDSLRQVYWKGLARGLPVQSKQYCAYADRSPWLDWEQFDGLGVEQRLSHLCYLALNYYQRNEDYGLRLPGVVIAPGRGELHRDQVLRALALYGLPAERR